MNKPTNTGTCIESGCTNNAAKGLKICNAHYGRIRRSSKKDGPIHGYATGQVLVSSPSLSGQVRALISTAAKNNDVSRYVIQNRVVAEWLGRYADGLFPFLCADALEADQIADPPYVQIGRIPISTEHQPPLKRALDEYGAKPHALMVAILDDWYRFWTSPAGKAAKQRKGCTSVYKPA